MESTKKKKKITTTEFTDLRSGLLHQEHLKKKKKKKIEQNMRNNKNSKDEVRKIRNHEIFLKGHWPYPLTIVPFSYFVCLETFKDHETGNIHKFTTICINLGEGNQKRSRREMTTVMVDWQKYRSKGIIPAPPIDLEPRIHSFNSFDRILQQEHLGKEGHDVRLMQFGNLYHNNYSRVVQLNEDRSLISLNYPHEHHHHQHHSHSNHINTNNHDQLELDPSLLWSTKLNFMPRNEDHSSSRYTTFTPNLSNMTAFQLLPTAVESSSAKPSIQSSSLLLSDLVTIEGPSMKDNQLKPTDLYVKVEGIDQNVPK